MYVFNIVSYMVPVWLSDNVLVFTNVVTLRWAWLVRGWVTVSGWINYFVAEPGTQVYIA